MAWNPSPEVAAARDFARKFNADRVVIIYVTKDHQLGSASYGETRQLCAEAKELSDAAYDAVMAELVKWPEIAHEDH